VRRGAEAQADLELAKLLNQDRVVGVPEAEPYACMEEAKLSQGKLDRGRARLDAAETR
jgi:hypothetical protein